MPAASPFAVAAPPQHVVRRRLRILWVNCRLLHPLNGGDRIRTYNMLKHLKQDHEVTYLCFQTPDDPPDAVRRAGEFCHRVITVPYRPRRNGSLAFFLGVARNSAFGRVPFFAEKYRSAQMTEQIRQVAQAGRADVIVADYLASMVHLTGLDERLPVPVVIFQHNVESQIWKRHADAAANRLKRLVFRRQWRMACEWERTCDTLADGQVTVSPEDAAFLRDRLGLRKILGDVPTGVDLEYFRPPTDPRTPRSLVFLGSMDWMANIDAVEFFSEHVWPAVRHLFPDASFTVVGRNPPSRIRDLERRSAGIRVTGTVDDVRPFLASAAAMVVPLRVGGGTRIKIFEGMATAIPVVTTRVGAEGLPVADGETALLADEAHDFVAQTAWVFEHPAQAARIGAHARALVEERFGWEPVTRGFADYCERVCGRPIARG